MEELTYCINSLIFYWENRRHQHRPCMSNKQGRKRARAILLHCNTDTQHTTIAALQHRHTTHNNCSIATPTHNTQQLLHCNTDTQHTTIAALQHRHTTHNHCCIVTPTHNTQPLLHCNTDTQHTTIAALQHRHTTIAALQHRHTTHKHPQPYIHTCTHTTREERGKVVIFTLTFQVLLIHI